MNTSSPYRFHYPFTRYSSNNDYYSHSSYSMYHSFHSSLLPPHPVERNSHMKPIQIPSSTFVHHQPIANPHQHLLMRTTDNYPSHLIPRQRTNWIKAGRKATHNQTLMSILPSFHESTSLYDGPIHIHHRISESLIYGLVNRISYVRLYAVDTESDKPSTDHHQTLPAIIQIQAIHHESYSTVIIIEVQHLPHPSSPLFRAIQQLCQMIFSSDNKIFAWGDVHKELSSFEQFNLFSLSQVTNNLNLQNYFTSQWNQMHPHTTECLHRPTSTPDEPESDDILICLVNTDDLNDDLTIENPIDDYVGCTCPSELRPYKSKNAIWSLQKAIQFVFNQALDKCMTFNIWSCGLDLTLNTWHSNRDKLTRQKLILYAMNDVFACTRLYFYLNTSIISSSSSDANTVSLNSTSMISSSLPMYFVLSDSHGKNLPPIITTSTFKLIVKSISGLQWTNSFRTDLCTRSLLSSSEISSYLSSCKRVLFLIGTNSIRNNYASNIISQISNIIDHIRSQHHHLSSTKDISIAMVFPCYKLSNTFPSFNSLSSNIQQYNTLLLDLSNSKNFSVIDLSITDIHLSHDRMHVDFQHLPHLYTQIQEYFNRIDHQHHKSTENKNRTHAARQRRNKRRHEKLNKKRKTLTVIRPIARVWQLQHLKTYLKHKQIQYSGLPEIRKHQLCIQFKNTPRQQYANTTLTSTDFDEQSYYDWISTQP